jgi:hypothetical protein
MSASLFRRMLTVLVLSLVLTAPWSSAAGLPGESVRPVKTAEVSPDLFGRIWNILSKLWSEEGCYIDPDGRCGARPAATPDSGCYIDPDGNCGARPTATPLTGQADSGCMIDPNGRCSS